MFDWGAVDRIDGWLFYEEGQALYDYARQSQVGVIEIGSYKGRSTTCLAMGVQDGHRGSTVMAIDTHRDAVTGEETALEFERNIEPFAAYVSPVIMTSTEAAAQFHDTRCDLLFIDANHSEENVRQDSTLWLPHVVEGGLVAFHDYKHEGYPGVEKVVAELVQSGQLFWFSLVWSLAVLRKVGP